MSIRLEHVSYAYEDNSSKKNYALKDINLEIKKEEFIAVIGHTGSGKSTLIQHLNGLIKPTSGTIYFDDEDIYSEGYPLRELRGKVGICFQYPEHQLFETTILDDVCFGPMNFGKTKEEATEIAVKCLKDVGLPEKLYQKSPFELSGGQKRRVAIAGILAMEPEYFILDEPTAGLDPGERIRFRNIITEAAKDRMILVATHIVSDVEYIANHIIMLQNGRLACEGTSEELRDKIKGQVFCICVDENKADLIRRNYLISNMKREKDKVILRGISDHIPKGAEIVEPQLEEVFLSFFRKESGIDEDFLL